MTINNKLSSKSLKDKTIYGMIWSFVERFGYLSIQFISNIILARLLTPADFGLIGMMMVFVAISNVLIEGGLGSALIQKINPTKEDYSTIFFTNIIIAILIYFILFFTSSNIASFYHQSKLAELLKIIGLILIIDSFSIVQNNILIKNINFKKIAKIKITSAFFSSSVAIFGAYYGYGVWSLVIQNLLNSTIRSFLLWITSSFVPMKIFNKDSFKELFGFGSKLLVASLLSEIYRNFQALIIGRSFTPKDLGFYTQANQLQQIPVSTLAVVVNQVTFPVFSELQHNQSVLIVGLRKSLKSLVYINFPLMVVLVVIAEPLFLLLFTDKWLSSVPYFQLLCLGFGMLLIVHNTNLNVLKSIKRSDMVLYLEIIKKIIGVILILGGIKYGIVGMIIGLGINSYLEFFLNGFVVGKNIGYGITKQIKDIGPAFILSITTGIIVYFLFQGFYLNYVVKMILQVLLYVFLYLIFSYFLKFEAFTIYFVTIKNLLIKTIKR